MKRCHPFISSIIIYLLAAATRAQTVPQPSHPIHVAGTLERVDGKSLILKLRRPQDGQSEISLPTDDATKFNIDGDAGTLADLQPDMGIAARETPQSDDPTKFSLLITAKSLGISGTLASIDGNTINLDVPQVTGGTKSIQVQTDDKTRIISLSHLNAPPLSLADLKPGMRLHVVPSTGVAKKIFATPAFSTPSTQPTP
jgi:hypothetical protein